MSTAVHTNTHEDSKMSVQPQTFTQFINNFPPILYTSFFSNLNLLNSRLYTVSTAPIINENKKK